MTMAAALVNPTTTGWLKKLTTKTQLDHPHEELNRSH